MKGTRATHALWLTLAVAATWCAMTPPAHAQLPAARLYAVFPPGGKAGESIDVSILSGADLDEVDTLVFSHPGITARQKVQQTPRGPQPVANAFEVTIKPDVPPGLYEVHAKGVFGLSNPRAFVVDTLPSIVEKEPNESSDQATTVELNRVVEGRFGGTADVDLFRLQGKKGQRILVEAQALQIDSRALVSIELLKDGRPLDRAASDIRRDPVLDHVLPADGEYVLKVYDAIYRGGNEYFYRLRVHTGPHLDFAIPPAAPPGSSSQITLFGRNLPGGQSSDAVLNGDPLQKLIATIRAPNEADALPEGMFLSSKEAFADGFLYALQGPEGRSNALFLGFSHDPIVLEKEPNDVLEQAQTIAVPVDFVGQLQRRGDIDRVVFEGKKSQQLWVEVIGERDASVLDAYVTVDQILVDKEGKVTGTSRLTAQDDFTAAPDATLFDTRSDDPIFSITLPADGRYLVSIRDRYFESRGRPDMVYRLVLREPRPDFRVVLVPYVPTVTNNNAHAAPWPLTLRRNDSLALKALVQRRDGFAGPVRVHVEGLPQGTTADDVVVGQNNVGVVVIRADADAPAWLGPIRATATARIPRPDPGNPQAVREVDVTHPVRFGTVVWGGNQNMLTVGRVARSTLLNIIEEVAPVQVIAGSVVDEGSVNRQVLVPVRVRKQGGFDDKVTIKWLDQPKQVQVTNVTIDKGKDEGLARIFIPANAPQGVFTLRLEGEAQVSYSRNPQRVERLKAEQQKIAEELKAAQQAQQKAKTEADAATKALADAANMVKAKTAAREKAKAALQQAQQAAQAAEKALADASRKLDAVAKLLAAAEKDEAKKGQVPQLKQQVEAAQKAKADAEKKLADARQALQQAMKAAQQAEQELAAAVEAQKKAEATKAEKDAALKQAEEKVKALTAAKTAVDKEVTAAANAAKPKAIKIYPAAAAITIINHPAPFTLSASVPNGGTVKRGQSLEIKVAVKRNKDFKEPVTVQLMLPPGTKGIQAAAVQIPADKSEAVLKVQVSGDAPEGAVPFPAIRGTATFQGKPAVVDSPITLKITK